LHFLFLLWRAFVIIDPPGENPFDQFLSWGRGGGGMLEKVNDETRSLCWSVMARGCRLMQESTDVIFEQAVYRMWSMVRPADSVGEGVNEYGGRPVSTSEETSFISFTQGDR
jgi:hypothetical protein